MYILKPKVQREEDHASVFEVKHPAQDHIQSGCSSLNAPVNGGGAKFNLEVLTAPCPILSYLLKFSSKIHSSTAERPHTGQQ